MRHLIDLLKLLDAAEGSIETRIRVQKQAYFLAAMFPNHFDLSDFQYHHYGPYSRSLSEALQSGVSAGLILEEDLAGSDPDFSKYRYSLTKAGKQVAGEIGGSPKELSEFVDKLSSEDWRTLELASTIHYLEQREGTDRSSALQKALRLKPKTAHREKEALGVLSLLN